jgi:serine/threonine protein kinase
MKILKQLNHKNIVPLTDIAVERGKTLLLFYCEILNCLIGDVSRKEKGSVYMVFPYMDHDLAGLLDNPKVRLTQPQIKTYLRQLLEGTAYLHHVKYNHSFI